MVTIQGFLSRKYLKIIVKTGQRETNITSVDESRDALRMDIAAQPIDNKANIEIIRFFKKEFKKNVKIKSGVTSKEKLLEIE